MGELDDLTQAFLDAVGRLANGLHSYGETGPEAKMQEMAVRKDIGAVDWIQFSRLMKSGSYKRGPALERVARLVISIKKHLPPTVSKRLLRVAFRPIEDATDTIVFRDMSLMTQVFLGECGLCGKKTELTSVTVRLEGKGGWKHEGILMCGTCRGMVGL